MGITLIQKLANIDIGAVIEVKARKGFKDVEFTPVGAGSPVQATVVAKKGSETPTGSGTPSALASIRASTSSRYLSRKPKNSAPSILVASTS